jgi:para-aminobenzoate synthetase/4-amino-4-deoxychorismate lyase
LPNIPLTRECFLFHKTTKRDIYELREKIFLIMTMFCSTTDWGIDEFTIKNLVVEFGGKLCTPPISCGLLAGTFRIFAETAG